MIGSMRTASDVGGEEAPGEVLTALTEARDHLKEAAARQATGDELSWLERVRTAARLVFDALEQHRGLAEEEGGVLADATERKPGLMPTSQRLEHEHADMLHRAGEIEIEAERQLMSEDFDIGLVRLQATVLRDILLLHIVRADSLQYEAYLREEGGEGG